MGQYDNMIFIMPGIAWDKANKKWHAEITYKGECIFIGLYRNFDKAVSTRGVVEALLQKRDERESRNGD
jgi:hypothetical protein